MTPAWEFLNVVELNPPAATGETYRYIADGQYTTDAITVDSCQTLNSSPFGGFDHSHSRSLLL
jgi:hypothetical protein